ncbi:MAG: DUF4350 domain-containing protein [Planctomycetota bacterium]
MTRLAAIAMRLLLGAPLLLGALVLDKDMAPLGAQLRAPLAATTIAMVAIIVGAPRLTLATAWRLLAALVATFAVGRLPGSTALLAYALAVVLVEDAAARSLRSSFPHGIARAIVCLACAVQVLQLAAPLERMIDGFIRAVTQSCGGIGLGLTAAGTKGWIAGALFAVTGTHSFKRAVAGLLVVTAAWLSAVAGASLLLAAATEDPFRWTPYLAVLPVAFALVMTAFTERAPALELRPRLPLVSPVLIAASTLLALIARPELLQDAPAQPRVLAVNEGGLDWHRPRFGHFGSFDGGMFGLLPAYLKTAGINFELAQSSVPSDEELATADLLLLINNPHVWSPEKRERLFDFVGKGKSLLVLGDHTDVFGLEQGFDSLLHEVGIDFRFDSAYHARTGWEGCLSAPPGFMSRVVHADRLETAVGASLELSGAAIPLATGRWGFSDCGDAANEGGAKLGNYKFEPGERLGDVDIVAYRTIGRGRVVVYGDTSAFQNGALPSTFLPHVLPLVRWLSAPAGPMEGMLPRLIDAALWLVTLLAVLWSRRTYAAALAASVVILLALVCVPEQGPASLIHTRDLAIVDVSHLPAEGHWEADLNPIYPLFSGLQRAGLLPLRASAFDALASVRAVVFVAPTRPFTTREVGSLVAAMQSGLIAIVAAGAPDSGPVEPLLRALDLEVLPIPLGTVPLRQGDDPDPEVPRLLDAWAIRDGSGVAPLIEQGPHAVAVWRPVRAGGLILIGDTRYFSDRNIEGDWGHWPGNEAFLYRLFRDYLGARPDDVADLLPSPPMPR